MQIRLINTSTLKLSEPLEIRDDDYLDAVPKYAVLSHRWQADEITFKDFVKGRNLAGAGYRKVVSMCKLARSRELEWVWIHTCCIDKRSSAELSEAINSMWAIYEESQVCIVYLHDLQPQSIDISENAGDLAACAWFERGWTLQELLASRLVLFCNACWAVVGYTAHTTSDRDTRSRQRRHATQKLRRQGVPCLQRSISDITRISGYYLGGTYHVHSASVAERMSWAARRTTTRLEDEAYCLLGLFDINMPLLYGEGRKAFRRLQEEIIKTTQDTSIFAWRLDFEDQTEAFGILAPSPRAFKHSERVGCGMLQPAKPYSITNMGLQLSAPAIAIDTPSRDGPPPSLFARTPKDRSYVIDLGCATGTAEKSWIHLRVKKVDYSDSIYRLDGHTLHYPRCFEEFSTSKARDRTFIIML